ncbi:phosphatidylserine/phosphatidylglycerophosphate/cardiolipin synthase family protein [Solirubrobacter phytolaccae]|uniref:Phosphatidylserine/phosphatidylglycerophosphate/ cardiolipin synthase family protein n=1 Tax=Solirubrobacter phytolaccae TaxID=1404360 RepID=A0A9X3NG08_9ACTN|nr:phosphatidylserine/phosphatidylglycerophosphate/cardiolipin synthase family protein [Solirubrobacter phytolaccae]MDA0185549.1 phosphatidylserine/phosphatidylglycerophosphate/cardiolipin synthase family protein [Solirubrobacter phytolaccae]
MRALDRVDAAVGGGIEHAMIHHHMRRLRRHGQLKALAPATEGLWAETAAPPRFGNAMEVLIDGANALPRMAEAIQGAQRHVHVCSWHLEPDFDPGPRKASPVKELLAEVAERVPVRVIVWAGAPVPVFQPRRGAVKAARERLVAGTKIQCQLDACTRLMHCHHEKLVIVDDELAFVGGIDLTTLAGDRYDTNEHAFKHDGIGWHDASAMLRGPIVRDVAAHFAMRWEATADEALELPTELEAAGDTAVQFTRTVPEGAYKVLPRGEFSVLETYIRALRSAQRLIYLENQFLWSPEIVHILETKLRTPPSPDFRVVVLLPHKANNGQDDTRGMLARLVEADDGRKQFLAATIMSRSGEQSGPLYVHAKIGIVDDEWLAIGSANLNEHSLFNDTEVDVVTCDPALARATRETLWAEHLERDDASGDATRLVDEAWHPIASEQLERQRAGAPLTHHLVELPGVSRRSRRLLGPLDALVVDG